MPRNVRNFWLEASIDGRSSKVACGSPNKEGGFELVVQVREEGSISNRKLCVRGIANADGTLELFAYDSSLPENEIRIVTKR